MVLADEPDRGGAPTVDECSVTPAQITAYLARRLPGSPDVAARSVSVVPGGRSKETILVTLTGTAELPPTVILRKDRPVGVLATRATDEFAVIRAVHEYGGVPVPEPYFAEREGHELGDGTFLIMECVAGHKAGEHFPDLAAPAEHREEIGLQLAAALARLHSLPLERLAGTSLGKPQAAPTTESVAATIGAIGARIDELTGPPCATAGLAREWLVEHADDVVPAPRLSLLQGDFGFHNMLVDGARVTALVDWEGASVGPPARELAAAYNAANALMPWSDFVDAYVRAGGSPEDADPRAIGYYRVLTAFGAFMANRTGGHLFRTGAKRDLLTAHSGLDARIRCERNLARALHDAM
jgi:aminoglycoside phosphotransferase (APT) family kinase protein